VLYIRSACISSFCGSLGENKSGGKEEHLMASLTLDWQKDQKHQKGAKKCHTNQKQKNF